MMYLKSKFSFVEDDTLACTAIEIPYKGKDLSMVVILPDEDFGLEVSFYMYQNLTFENKMIMKQFVRKTK